jgi:hypothetical protein
MIEMFVGQVYPLFLHLDDVLRRLEMLECQIVKSDGYFMATCPSDRAYTLLVSDEEVPSMLCKDGCTNRAVVRSLRQIGPGTPSVGHKGNSFP